MKVFSGLGYKMNQVDKVDTSTIPEGPGIFISTTNHPNGSLIVSKGTVYLILNNQLDAFPSKQVFDSYGYSFKYLAKANSYDLGLPVGDVVQGK